MSPDDITVIIPAAGRVPEGLIALSNISCPAMVPVGGRPVIHWTMRYLSGLGLRRFVIAVAQRGTFVEDFVECTFGKDCDVTFVVPPAGGGVGTTVDVLLREVTTPGALVVLGDTHFQFADPALLASDEPFVLVSPVDDSYRWCVAETDEQGWVTALRDKEPGLESPLAALVGVYGFPDADLARGAAAAAVAGARERGVKAELAAILERVRAQSPIRAVPAGDWLDCGNPDRQAASHRALLQKRAFNELSIDPVVGTITKRSRHVEKFIDEINYLRLLPPDVAVLFPRVLEASTDWAAPHLRIEYYGYPTLAEVFVFENVDPAIWERVFVHLAELVGGVFGRHRRPLAGRALHEMYVSKTQQRLAALDAPADLRALVRYEGHVVVNGRRVRNVPLLWEAIEREVTRMTASGEATVIHGDLCLSNVLYDLRSRICKLVDPRGSFGTAGIFGDPRYDVAKLYHSVYGFYDFITNDLFHVRLDGLEVQLDIRSRPQHTDIRARFEKVFFPAWDRREVLLVTALLFASMPVLHYERPARQIAMYARALQLLDEVFSS